MEMRNVIKNFETVKFQNLNSRTDQKIFAVNTF